MSFKSTLSTDVTGTLKADTAQTLTLGRRGQNGRLAFAGTAGQTVALQVAGQTTVPSSRMTYYTVYAPDGSTLGSTTATSAATLNLPNLPATGTYTVFVDPSNGETLSAQLTLATGTAGGQTTNGASGSYATTVPGQNVYLTFKAAAGQNVGLALSDLVTPNSTNYVYLTVYKPDGSYAASQYCYASNNGCQTNLGNTMAGTYSVVVNAPYDGDQTMSFKATVSSDVTGTLQADTAQTLTLGRRGQNGRLSFAGTAGQTLAVQVAGQTTVPSGRTTYYTVYAPDGTALASSGTTSATTLNLSNLPATGTYTVFVDPSNGETLSAQLTLATGTAGGQTTNGASGSYATTVPGQNVYLTFKAAAGQNLGLGLSDLVTPNSTNYVYLTVYKPDGSYAASQYCYASNNGCQTNLGNTMAGTYSVVVNAPYDGDQTMSFKATVSSDVTGTLQADTAQTLTLGRRGQNGRLSFAGTAGQTLAVQVAGQTTVPSGRTTYYTVYAPDGTALASSGTTSATTLNLSNLPATGTYTVFVDPSNGETLSAQLTLATGTAGGQTTNGASGSYATTVPGQNVYLTFKAAAGQNLGLGLSDLVTPNSTNYVYLTVYKPDGSYAASQYCYASNNGCQTNLGNTMAGTYSVVVNAPYDGDQTMSFKATVSSDVTGTLQADTAQTLTLGRRGQNGRLSFAGTAGQTLAVQVAGQTTVPSGRTTYYTVYAPDGTALASSGTTSATTLNLSNLPATGTYTVFVDPSNGETLSAQLTLATGTAGGQTINGASGSYATTVPGQNVYLTFKAAAGQNLGLGLSDLVTPNSTNYVYLTVYKPDGSYAASQYCYASNNGCQTNLGNTMAGTYSVVVNAPYDGDQTMSFKATVSSDVTGTLQADTAQTLTLGRRGQNGRLSFAGTAGQTLAVQVAGQTTVPSGRTTYYTVYAPDGTALASSGTTSATTLNLSNLPATGTYTVFVDPSNGETLSAQLTLATGTAGGQTINGASGSYATTVPGQNVYLTFKAAAGQNLGLGLSDLVTPNSTNYVYLTVYKPDGSYAASQYCYASNNGCQTNLGNTMAGTYSVVVNAPYDGDQTMSFKATVSSDVTGTLQADTAQTLTLGRRGQNGRLSFAGTAGQTLAVQVAGQTTVPSGRTTYYTVYAPDGTALASSGTTSATTLNLSNLPATGTYTVFVDPSNGETLSAQLTLATGTAGGQTTNGASGSYATTVPGQNVYLTFKAAAGQNLGLGLSDLVTPNSTNYVYLTVYKPDGSYAASQYCYASNNGCQTNLGNTMAGTYSVVVNAPYDGDQTMSFKATVSSDVTGTLQADTAQTLTLGRRGQNGRLSFAGTAGQTLAVQVAGQTTVPSGRTTYYTVYAPDGSTLASTSATSATTLNLASLPTTGTYTMFVDPYYGETSSAQLTLASSN
ncbi:beta strand repeat-containing protein [Xanthomonas oryzae]|nr:glutamate synthase [Xanthomonas oryzae]